MLHKREYPSAVRASALLFFILLNLPYTFAQLNVLSTGNLAQQWRASQIESVQKQLNDTSLSQELLEELNSQQQWLQAWRPGSLPSLSSFEQLEFPSAEAEPVIDPDGIATEYRNRLFGKGAQPTATDTQALRDALQEHPNDIGLKQLHLHWLDQVPYRKSYAKQIAESAAKLASLLDQQSRSEDIQRAQGFCYFRAARALTYCELPEVIAKQPIDDFNLHEAELLDFYNRSIELLGSNHPELILLNVRMLRRDKWLGRALMLLERSTGVIEPQWYLKKRRDILVDLAWSFPAEEAASIYAKKFPKSVAEEREFQPSLGR
jgi:hypothetical protein